MANELERPAPPALPLATETYDRPFMDQNSNVLRLFFTRLVNAFDNLVSTDDGGKFLYIPRGLFYSTVDQTAALANTGYPIKFENSYLWNSVSIEGTNKTRITVTADGIYNFQVTLQLEHNNSSAVTLWTWINKNGTDQPYGGQKNTIKGNDDTAVHWNFSIDLTAGQYIEMYWATSDTQLNLHTEAATAPHPGLPSSVVAVSFVSNS